MASEFITAAEARRLMVELGADEATDRAAQEAPAIPDAAVAVLEATSCPLARRTKEAAA